MKKILMLGVCVAPLFGAVAARAATASSTDIAFMAKVSQGGMFEVAAGQLASTQGSTQDIRDQGATEAHDHQLVGDKLRSIATADGQSFPTALDASFQSELNALSAAHGKAFDTLYLRDMVVVHDGDGAAFAAEAKNGSDPALRAFAAETHRIVVRHLGELKALPAG